MATGLTAQQCFHARFPQKVAVEGGLLGAAALAGGVHALEAHKKAAHVESGISAALPARFLRRHAGILVELNCFTLARPRTAGVVAAQRVGEATSSRDIEEVICHRQARRHARINATVHARGWLAIQVGQDWRVPPSSCLASAGLCATTGFCRFAAALAGQAARLAKAANSFIANKLTRVRTEYSSTYTCTGTCGT